MANDDDTEPTPRQEFEVSVTTTSRGKLTLKMLDRINVDDIFLHLVHQEIFSIKTGNDPDDEVNQLFKDFLLKERFTAGQN
jgi:hypothetical protein